MELLWAWSLTGIAVSVVVIVLIWTIKTDIAYGIAWGALHVWGFLGACVTIPWVKRSLAREKATWQTYQVSEASGGASSLN